MNWIDVKPKKILYKSFQNSQPVTISTEARDKFNWAYPRWIVRTWRMIPGAVERVFPHPGHVHLYKVFKLELDEVDACEDNAN